MTTMKTKSTGRFEWTKLTIAAFVAGMLIVPPEAVASLPNVTSTNLNVVYGTVPAANITTNTSGGINTLNIAPTTSSTILAWNNLSDNTPAGGSLGSSDVINFNLPSASSAILNEVTGGNATILGGAINSNGSVYFLNPAGIAIGSSSVINVGGFYASTIPESNTYFQNNNTLQIFSSSPQVYNVLPNGNTGVVYVQSGASVKATQTGGTGVVGLASGYALTATTLGSNGTPGTPGYGVTIDAGTTLAGNLLINTQGPVNAQTGGTNLTVNIAGLSLATTAIPTSVVNGVVQYTYVGGSGTIITNGGSVTLGNTATNNTVSFGGSLSINTVGTNNSGSIAQYGTGLVSANTSGTTVTLNAGNVSGVGITLSGADLGTSATLTGNIVTLTDPVAAITLSGVTAGKGGLTLNSASNVTVTNAVAPTVSLNAGSSSISYSGTGTTSVSIYGTPNSVSVTEAGNLTAANAIISTGPVTLNSSNTSGTLTLSGSVTANSSAANAAGAVNLNAGGALALNSYSVSGNAITITSTGNAITGTGAITGNGAITITASGTTASSLTGAITTQTNVANIAINAAAGALTTGNVYAAAGGTITVNSGGALTIDPGVAGGFIGNANDSSVTLTGLTTTTTKNIATITSNSSANGGLITIGGGNGAVTLYSSTITGNAITITSTGNAITGTSAITGNGAITITAAGGNSTITQVGIVSEQTNPAAVSISTTNGALTIGSSVTSAGNITLNASGAFIANGNITGNILNITSTSNTLTSTSSVITGNSVTISGYGAVSTGNVQGQGSGSSVSITSTANTLLTNNAIDAQTITLQGSGLVTINGTLGNNGGGNTVSNDGTTLTITSTGNGVTFGTGVGSTITPNASNATINITSQGNGVALNGVNIGTASNSNLTVILSASGNVTETGNIYAKNLTLSGTGSTSSVTANGANNNFATLTVTGTPNGANVTDNLALTIANLTNTTGNLTVVTTNNITLGGTLADTNVLSVGGNLSLNSAGVLINNTNSIAPITTNTYGLSVYGTVTATTNGATIAIGTGNFGNNLSSFGQISANSAGGNVTIQEAAGTNLGNVTTFNGTLTVNSAGNITNTGNAVVNTGSTGVANFNVSSSSSNISIGASKGYSLIGGTISTSNAGTVTIYNDGYLGNTTTITESNVGVNSLSVTTNGGNLAINSIGSTQGIANIGFTTGNAQSITITSNQATTLTNATTGIGLLPITVNVTANAGLTLGSGISLLSTNAGSLATFSTKNAASGIIQDSSSVINISGNANFAGSSIILNGANHTIATPGFTSNGTITYTGNGNITLNTVQLGTNATSLSVSAVSGNVTQINPIITTNTVSTITIGGTNVTLSNASNSINSQGIATNGIGFNVTGNASLTNTQGVVIGSTVVQSGYLTINTVLAGSTGNISEAPGSTIWVYGNPTFTTNGAQINLTNAGNNFGQITVNTVGGSNVGTGANIAVRETGTNNYYTINTGNSGTFTATDDLGNIQTSSTANSSVNIGGLTTLTASNGSITLNATSESIAGNILATSGGNTSLTVTTGNISFATGTSVGGNLTLINNGYNTHVNDSGSLSTLSVGGILSVTMNSSDTNNSAYVSFSGQNNTYGGVILSGNTTDLALNTIVSSGNLVITGVTSTSNTYYTAGGNITTNGSGLVFNGLGLTSLTGNITISNEIRVNSGYLSTSAPGVTDLSYLSKSVDLFGINPLHTGNSASGGYKAPGN